MMGQAIGISEADIQAVNASWAGYTEGSDCSAQKKLMTTTLINFVCSDVQNALANDAATTDNEKNILAASCKVMLDSVAMPCDQTNHMKAVVQNLVASKMMAIFGAQNAAVSSNADSNAAFQPAGPAAMHGPVRPGSFAARHTRSRRSPNRQSPTRRSQNRRSQNHRSQNRRAPARR